MSARAPSATGSRSSKKGLLRVTALVNLYEDPDYLSAYVLVRLKSRDLLGAVRAFSRLPWVNTVSAVAGQYDLVAEILVPNKTSFIDFVTKQLAEVEDVATAESLVIFKSINNGPPLWWRNPETIPARGAGKT